MFIVTDYAALSFVQIISSFESYILKYIAPKVIIISFFPFKYMFCLRKRNVSGETFPKSVIYVLFAQKKRLRGDVSVAHTKQ